jgi:hypothetical protein
MIARRPNPTDLSRQSTDRCYYAHATGGPPDDQSLGWT